MSDRVTILHVGEGESRQAWKESLADRPWEQGTLIKRDGEREVWRAIPLGEECSIKVRPLNRVRARLGLSEYARAIRAERLLEDRGFSTPRCKVRACSEHSELLVHPWIANDTLLQLLSQGDEQARCNLLVRAGDLVGRLARAKILNRDLKPSNILVGNTDVSPMSIIDIGGVRRVRLGVVSELRAYTRMTNALITEPTGVGISFTDQELQALFESSSYALLQGRGAFQDLPHFNSAELVRRARCGIAAHGDTKPKINPLEPPRP